MTDRNDRFTGKMFSRLWVPAMVASAGWAFSDMADAVVVGQMLGPTGLAAISLALPVYMISCMFAHSLGLGGSARCSKLLGEGKEQEAAAGFRQILPVALALGIFIAAAGIVFLNPLLALLGTTPQDGLLFSATKAYLRIFIAATPLFFLSNLLNYYLRNDNNQKLASIGSAVGNVCDLAFNLIFVVLCHWGTGGAALATVLGHAVSVTIYLWGFFGKRQTLTLGFAVPNLKEIFLCFQAGFSTSVQYLFQLVFLLVSNRILMRIGGELGVAVFDMVQNASYLILYLYEGTARAMQPLVSTYHGEHYSAGKRNTLRLGLVFGSAAGLCLAAFVAFFPQVLCSLFGLLGTEAEGLGRSALKIYAIGTFFGGISILLGSYFQACEKEAKAFFIVLLRGALVLLPCLLLFASFGISLFWWLFPVTEILSLAAYLLWLKFAKQAAQSFDSTRVYSRTIQSKNEDLGAMLTEVEAFCEKWNANAKQLYYVAMTVEEICLAIVKNGFEQTNQGYLQLTLIAMENGTFELHLRDNAVLFNPFLLETKKAGHAGEYDMDAMGMRVVKSKATSFFYRRYQGFNLLVVTI